MACKACGAETGAEVCLHCGHEFCGQHRDEAGGVQACFECLKAEAARKSARRIAPTKAPIAADVPVAVKVKPPPAPLPEPKGNLKPFAVGALVAAPSAGYLHWALGTLVAENQWPGVLQPVGAAAFGLFVLAGVFAIVKTR